MRRYNIVSRIILIPTVITFALAAPVLVQEKRQACVDVVHVPEDVVAVLGKRTLMEDGLRYYVHVWGDRNMADVRLQDLAPPPNAPLPNAPPPNVLLPNPEVQLLGVHAPPQNPAEVHVPEVHMQPQNPVDPDRESIELDDNAPPGSPESGQSHSWPTSPGSSTKSGDWYTAPPSLGSSTESDSDPDRWSTISNAPSAESQSENFIAAEHGIILTKGKAKVSDSTSGTDSDVDI